MSAYYGYSFHGMRVARLQLDAGLGADVARASVSAALRELREQAGQAGARAELPKLPPARGFPAVAEAAVAEATGGAPRDLAGVLRVLERKFEAWQESPPEAAAPPVSGRTPYLAAARATESERAAAGRIQRHSEAAEAARARGEALRAEFTRAADGVNAQWAAIDRLQASRQKSGVWKAAWQGLAASGSLASAVWIAGLSPAATAAAGAGSAALMGVWIALQARSLKHAAPADNLWRELARPCTATLLQYFEARESERRETRGAAQAIGESQVAAEWARLAARMAAIEEALAVRGETAFTEVHPTRVVLGGRRVTEILAANCPENPGAEALKAVERESGLPLADWALRTEPDAAAARLVEAARAGIGDPRLGDVLETLWKKGFRAELERQLADLRDLCWAVVREKPGIRIDRALCPKVLTIGLPEGSDDPAAPMMCEQFPGAAVVRGFEGQAVEIVTDVHNLSLDHLLMHSLSAESYTARGAQERQLWHMPRRLRAVSEQEPLAAGG